MTAPKIVLRSAAGYRPELDELVAAWMSRGVRYVGVVGVDSSRLDDIIDELCVGDGSRPYEMLTAFHGPEESLQDALALASKISEEFGSGVEVVEF
jgi:hypothetical protein